ncbi:MAG: phospholipase D-like domain-containing protein [Gemmatimonadaceae bacterium]
MSLIWPIILILIVVVGVAVTSFVYMTLAINADANRQDRVDAAPPIFADPSAFLRALHGAAGEPPSTGNHVELLQNGDEIFPAMIAAVRNSRETVHFSSYVYWAGVLPKQFAALFCETARRGVTVRIVLDSEGADLMPAALIADMRAAGCHVALFGRVRWYAWMRYNRRTHRRLLIVDGTVGFTGGVGIADEWSGHAQSPAHWRDTHARLTGPVVSSLQAAFADNWNQCTDELLLNARDYPIPEVRGKMEACMVVSSPANGSSPAQRAIAACIAGATRSLHITNAYFVPTPAFVENLCIASERGVDVKIIVPGPYHDMPVVRHASWHVWPTLLARGVEIYEFQPTMIHCKTLTVDGQVSLVSSINFDPRSFALNGECGVVVADSGLATEMERAFAADLERSAWIGLAAVSARGVLARARDAVCYWIRAQL